MKIVKQHKNFGGSTNFYMHASNSTKTEMSFSAFLPGREPKSCIIFLSGLTCTPENFITKAGAQNFLKDSSTMIICPDTSPRGLNLNNEHASYDFGSAASFYIDATTPGYKDHYKMFKYISHEFFNLIVSKFKIAKDKISIMGHSMGGHGALIHGLTNPDKFQSISAFSPIVNPINSPWGQKAFNGYLSDDQNEWKKYDACELVKSGHKHKNEILIDQGSSDEFLEKQLLTKNFEEVCKKNNQKLKVNYREGYDHSYYFISSFIESHIKFHLGVLS